MPRSSATSGCRPRGIRAPPPVAVLPWRDADQRREVAGEVGLVEPALADRELGEAAAIAALKMLTLDSSDSRRDAAFWSAVLGWEVAHEAEEYAMLTGPGGPALGFGTVADHQAPGWPNARGTKQFHLDLAVDDLDAGVAACVELGATFPDDQPGETWRVLLDPSGHPFCLTLAANWG